MPTRGYEVLFILKVGGTEQELARATAQVEEPITRLGGRVEVAQNMGRRRLAFRIAKQTEGHYHFVRFQATGEQLAELDRLFRLNEEVVRFVILSAEQAEAAQATLTPFPAGPFQARRGRQDAWRQETSSYSRS